MKIAYLGLGKMGMNMALRLKEHGHEVVCWNRGEEGRKKAEAHGLEVVEHLKDAILSLERPRLVWLMVSHGAVDEIINQITPLLSEEDIVIDGGNTFFKETKRRAKDFELKKIHFLDVGVSGGPGGARNGACLMIGGEKEIFEKLKSLFDDIASPGAVSFLGTHGAGHFAKMVHNGIEYGMMQSLGEGFEVLKKSDFDFDLWEVARIYHHRSVIESRLTGWLMDGLAKYGSNLDEISGSVAHSGEGQWTVETAKELGVSAKIIEESLEFRKHSQKASSFTGKIVSVLRTMFGGHDVFEK